MNKEQEIQKLTAYITGNCTDKEQLEVIKWIEASEENRSFFNDLRLVWESTATQKKSLLIDVDSRWDDFKTRTSFDHTLKSNNSNTLWVSFARAAAVIVILFSIWIVADNNFNKEVTLISYVAPSLNIDDPFVLPDGTEVILNENSELTFPENLEGDLRELNFKGEAFFNVAHNPEKPMIISTGDIRIKVLGTSFNLCNCNNSNEIVLHLETGKVLFYSVNPVSNDILEQVILLPGEMGIYNKITGSISKDVYMGSNHLAWKSGVLSFVNAPLNEVLESIAKVYDIKVESNIDLSKYRLTAKYKNESPENILESLQIIYGFTCVKEGDIIVIR